MSSEPAAAGTALPPPPGGIGRLARLLPLLRVLLGQGLASLASFLTVIALGRWGGAADLGAYALGWSVWFLVSSLQDALVATPYTYHRAQPQPLVPDLAATALLGTLGLLAAVLPLLVLLVALGVQGLAPLGAALPLAVAAAALRELMRRHLLATGEAARLLRLDALSAGLQLAGVAALAGLGALHARSAFYALAAAAALPLLPALGRLSLDRLRAAGPQAGRGLRVFVADGRWLLAGGCCHVLSVQAYPWLALAAGGERLAGLYAACNALLNLLAPLMTGLTNHGRPRFMAARVVLPDAAFHGYVLRRIPLFLAPALALAAVLLLAGGPLLGLIYGPGFVEAAPALAWMALGSLGVALGAPLQLGLLALRAPVSNLAYHGVALALLGSGVALGLAGSLDGLGRLHGGINLLATGVLAALYLRYRPR